MLTFVLRFMKILNATETESGRKAVAMLLTPAVALGGIVLLPV